MFDLETEAELEEYMPMSEAAKDMNRSEAQVRRVVVLRLLPTHLKGEGWSKPA